MDNYLAAVKLWQKFNIETEADIDLRLHSFRILFAYNSGKIENAEITYHDTREIFENGRVVNFTGTPRAIFEQRNQKLCYDFLKPKLIFREPITIELVKEVHAILTGGTYDETRYIERGERPGEFKKHDYVTGIEEVGSLPEGAAGVGRLGYVQRPDGAAQPAGPAGAEQPDDPAGKGPHGQGSGGKGGRAHERLRSAAEQYN